MIEKMIYDSDLDVVKAKIKPIDRDISEMQLEANEASDYCLNIECNKLLVDQRELKFKLNFDEEYIMGKNFDDLFKFPPHLKIAYVLGEHYDDKGAKLFKHLMKEGHH